MLTDAAASQTPITVSELLTRSEKLALGDSSGSPEPTLGRAIASNGDRAGARNAFETAIAQFSNTVDSDHPHLLAARAELREATARNEHDQQHPER
jgi:hypothetical protein